MVLLQHSLCCHTAGCQWVWWHPGALCRGVAPGEPRLAMGTVQTGSWGSAVSAVLKIPLQRAWRPTFLQPAAAGAGSSACCGLVQTQGRRAPPPGALLLVPAQVPAAGRGREAYGTDSGCVTSQQVEGKHIPGMASLASGSPAAVGVSEFLLSAASGSLAPCNSRGAVAAGWCGWSRCCQHSPHSGADRDGCGVHVAAPCPCPGLAVPGSATQRGQGGGHLPGCAAGCSARAAAPLCALPRHTRPHGQRVPRAGQHNLIPISPCRMCSNPRMQPSRTCSTSWPECAR